MIIFQRLESFAILIVLIFAYHGLEFSWLWFVVFLLAPDISMLGYLKNAKVGAIVYNIGHSYFSPIILLLIGIHLQPTWPIMVAIIWAAHIALDRVLGFGLKLPTGFKDTHLGKLRR